MPYVESGSQGTFRYYPGFTVANRRYGKEYKEYIDWFSKAAGEESLQLPFELQEALAKSSIEHIGIDKDSAQLILIGSTNKYSNVEEARNAGKKYTEVNESPNDIEGISVDIRDYKERPEEIDFKNEEDRPDFSNKVASWQKHSDTYQGIVNFDVYPSNDGKLRYLFCKDKNNRAWVGGIEVVSSEINSKGLKRDWIQANALTMPANEYRSNLKFYEAQNIAGDKVESSNYYDTFENYLSKIPIIKDYLALENNTV